VRITEDRLPSFLEEIGALDGAPEGRQNSHRLACTVCGAFLSRYNPSKTHCAVHEPPSFRSQDRY
jgi:hypothetical protein